MEWNELGDRVHSLVLPLYIVARRKDPPYSQLRDPVGGTRFEASRTASAALPPRPALGVLEHHAEGRKRVADAIGGREVFALP